LEKARKGVILRRKKEVELDSSEDLSSQESLKHLLSKKNPTKVLENLIEKLKSEYHFSDQDVIELVGHEEELKIPLSVFTNNSGTVLQILVKYLKEEKHLSYSKIGELLGRDERSIWSTYNSKNPINGSLHLGPSKISIPLSVFEKAELSALEALVYFLKEHHYLQFSIIAGMIKRDRRTVWSAYNSAVKKKGGAKNG